MAVIGIVMAAALLGAGSASAATPQPVEGDWNYMGGQILVQQNADGTFTGTVVVATTFTNCSHAVGQQLWTLQGSGLSYTGTVNWYDPHCAFEGTGQGTWQMNTTNPAQYTVTFCTARPHGGAPNPSDPAPNHTLCFTLTRAIAAGQTPAPPTDLTPPVISGTSSPGSTLTCSPGTWTGNPTGYTYQWDRDGTPLAGATSPTYKVQTLDEGLTLTCVVTAFNQGGAGHPATSAGFAIPVPVVKGCPKATGKISGKALGLVRLGMTRAQARKAYTKSSTRGAKFKDFFCLTPIGVRVGYASTTLLNTLKKKQRGAYKERVVWASTSNPFYAIKTVRPGASLQYARKHVKLGKKITVGKNDWYLGTVGKVTVVFKARKSVVQEIGIANRALTKTRKQQTVFMRSFY